MSPGPAPARRPGPGPVPNIIPTFERLARADRAWANEGPAPRIAVYVVRADPDHYYAETREDGPVRWVRWLAMRGGWERLQAVDPPRDPVPLEPRPARLALLLSGAPYE